VNNFFLDVEIWLSTHQTLVVSLGVPLLTLLVTILASGYQDRRAAERQIFERRLQKILKISEFRQNWIDGLRSDIAELISLTVNPDNMGPDHAQVFNSCMARILMRVNPSDVDAAELKKSLSDLRHAKQDDNGELQSNLTLVGQRFLKKEWDRLRLDLDNIEKIRGFP
jgi:hypothetical protein